MSPIGKRIKRVDGDVLVDGRPVFTDDIDFPELLHGKILRSPLPHAKIAHIDTSEAEALPGVKAVLTYKNVPQVKFTTAGQGYPEPSPYDTKVLDDKVRFVGDRVAAVAAETEEIAEEAVSLIKVEYEELPAVFDPEYALSESAPKIHEEGNVASFVEKGYGDIGRAFEESDVIVEGTFSLPYAQHVPLEPHITITYLDEYGRLVIRSSTQVPFHVRRILSMILGLPVHKIRVIKPRIGGGFGCKQEIVLEDICALLTLRTGKPVRMELTREEEFFASRTRHPAKVRVKLGADRGGRLKAIDMEVLLNTGAYGAHAPTVLYCTGSRPLVLYNKAEAVRFKGRAVYTNLPVAGAYRGYGATQGLAGMETVMDLLADKLGMDPLELRLKNAIGKGETSPIFEELGEGRKGVPQVVESCGLEECIRRGAQAIDWWKKRERGIGVGMALSIQGSGIAMIDMGAATIRMNDDGTFMLYVGATDLGTGSDTILAQIAAEVLGVSVEDIYVYSSDTDFTPFDTGAYASSTTYVSGNAVKKAAEKLRDQILDVASEMLCVEKDALFLKDGKVFVKGDEERSVSLKDIGLRSLYVRNQRQLEASASFVSSVSPPPFAAHFAEVEVDESTGFVKVLRYVVAVDCGKVINPPLAKGQVLGAIANGIGYALFEEMKFNGKGKLLNGDLSLYKVITAADMPLVDVIFVETDEPTGPFGAKSVAEICINGPIPAIANAIYNAVGVRLWENPFTPERVLKALRG